MNSKIMLVSIAVLAVGLFAMPSTVSLISGQHAFIAYNDNNQTLSCVVCHADVTVTGVHGSDGDASWWNNSQSFKYNNTWNQTRWLGDYFNNVSSDKSASCRGCHVPGRVNLSLRIPLNGSLDNSTTPWGTLSNVTGAHIAVRAQCTICHDAASSGFNISTGIEAHRPLNDSAYATTSNLSRISMSDRVCIVCHTWAGISGANFGDYLAEKGNFTTTVSRYPSNNSWNVTYSNYP